MNIVFGVLLAGVMPVGVGARLGVLPLARTGTPNTVTPAEIEVRWTH
jgi:hypothetical protein